MARPKIMLVDDEKLILNALQRSLRREGYEIVLASCGPEALEYLKNDPDVAIIVSDYRMPKMTGLELLTEVLRLYPRVVRILLTGRADLDVAIEAINRRILYRFITKPWEESELKAHLRNALCFRKEVDFAREAVRTARDVRNNNFQPRTQRR